MLLPIEYAIGKAITAIMAMVPMEVPVAKEIITAIRKVSAGSNAGLKNCWKMLDRYVPVSSAFTTLPMVKPNNRTNVIGSMPLIPLKISSIT